MASALTEARASVQHYHQGESVRSQMDTVVTGAPVADSEFDLDVSIVESGPVIADLLRSTDDGCGSTCESACSNSTC